MSESEPTQSEAQEVGPTASVPPGLTAGTMIDGKYELSRKLGRGAMGEVWAARHVTMHEEVALKLVVRGVDNGDGSSAESRFLLEARVASTLSRKTRHIVNVTDHGHDGALGYLVMELLEGEPLDVRMQRTGKLQLDEAVPILTHVARGLAVAHESGVTHRDLKPSNVFVTTDDEGAPLAKVLDFGIAKLRAGLGRQAAFTTQRGFLLGTPAYMSPEQARGKPLDHRADVWALGVIAYHLLTDEYPFDGGTHDELFARIIKILPIPLQQHRPDLPPVVSDFFARAFARRIEDRFQSATSLASAFEQLASLAARGERVLPTATLLAADGLRAPVSSLVPSPSVPSVSSGPPRSRASDASLGTPGVPRRHPVTRPLLAGLLVGAVLASTIAVLSVYYEREPAHAPAQLTSGVAAPPGPIDPADPRSAVPPPEPTPEEPDDAPVTASVPAVARRAARPAKPSATPAPAGAKTRQARLPWEKGDIF